MAWDEEMVAIVRGLMMDYPDAETGDPAKYSDDRLATILLIAAQNVKARTIFASTYAVDVTNGTLKPDPTSKNTRDDNFINLASLKAACILANAEVREYTGQGISVRDGSSAVSLQRQPAALALLQKTYCQEFEDALYVYVTTGAQAPVGEAVVGPIKAEYFGSLGWPYTGPVPRILHYGEGRGEGWWG